MTKVEISHKTVFFVAIFLFFAWIVFQIRDVLFLLFIAFILMTILRPWVDKLERLRIPRGLAILLIYIGLIGFVSLLSVFFLPPLVSESIRFGAQIPNFIAFLVEKFPFIQINAQDIIPQIGSLGQNIFLVTVGVFSNIITLFMLFVATFYLLLERKHLSQFLQEFVGERMGIKIQKTIIKIETRLGAWIRGQLTLMVLIGVVVYIGLRVLQIPFALPLAIIAGLLEVVPNVGPIVSAILTMLVTLTISLNPLLIIAVASFYFIVQQIENSVIVPMIMRKVTGLPPLVTIIALLVGGRLGGVAGVLFAVPFVLIVQIIMQEFWIEKKGK